VGVKDDGAGSDPARLAATPGTGLSRLRERLAVLYGDRARLTIETAPGRGFGATLELPG
jgi:signal transduction histidine kinase